MHVCQRICQPSRGRGTVRFDTRSSWRWLPVGTAYSPVPELNLLKGFQDRVGFEDYAEGFGLTDYNDTSGLRAGWSKDPGFLARLVPFAQANGTGSFYALWRLDDRADLAGLPIVVFGDEGGQ